MAGYQGYNIRDALLHMRAGSDMYKRRVGWKYSKSQIDLLRLMKINRWIDWTQYTKSVVLRSISAIVPNWLRLLVFKKVPRK